MEFFEDKVKDLKDGDEVIIHIGSMSISDYQEYGLSGGDFTPNWYRENVVATLRLSPTHDGNLDLAFESIEECGSNGSFEAHYFNVLSSGDYVGENLFKHEYKTRVSLTKVLKW